MPKNIIILDKSELVQNICAAVLAREFSIEFAKVIEDLGVLLRELSYNTLIVGDSIFDKDRWNAISRLEKEIGRMRKVFLTESESAPSGFLTLKKPFYPFELMVAAGNKPASLKSGRAKRHDTSLYNNRRIFQRNTLDAKVYLNDELERPIMVLKARDISLGGVFLEGAVNFKIGSLLFLSLVLHGKKIQITGQVARQAEDGIGVRFLGLPSDAEATISSTISSQ